MKGSLALAALAIVLPGAAAARNCAGTLGELRALLGQPDFAQHWQETSMKDGKPLLVTLTEHAGELHLRFVKAHEGLWAEGTASICRDEDKVEAALPRQRISVGPAANWLLRQSLSQGARFGLALQAGQLKISTTGWSGVFVPLVAAPP